MYMCTLSFTSCGSSYPVTVGLNGENGRANVLEKNDEILASKVTLFSVNYVKPVTRVLLGWKWRNIEQCTSLVCVHMLRLFSP